LFEVLSDTYVNGNQSTDHLGQLITKKLKSTDHQKNGDQLTLVN